MVGVVMSALAFHQYSLESSQTRRHKWAEFVVGSLLCSERFSPGYSGFPSSKSKHSSPPQKQTLQISIRSGLEGRNLEKCDRLLLLLLLWWWWLWWWWCWWWWWLLLLLLLTWDTFLKLNYKHQPAAVSSTSLFGSLAHQCRPRSFDDSFFRRKGR